MKPNLSLLVVKVLLLVALRNSSAQPLVNLLQFTSTNYSASETGGVATITVEIAGGDYFEPNVYAVDYAILDGSARAGLDYLATSARCGLCGPKPTVSPSIFPCSTTGWWRATRP